MQDRQSRCATGQHFALALDRIVDDEEVLDYR